LSVQEVTLLVKESFTLEYFPDIAWLYCDNQWH